MNGVELLNHNGRRKVVRTEFEPEKVLAIMLAVEKGTNTVISANFETFLERRIKKLRAVISSLTTQAAYDRRCKKSREMPGKAAFR